MPKSSDSDFFNSLARYLYIGHLIPNTTVWHIITSFSGL